MFINIISFYQEISTPQTLNISSNHQSKINYNVTLIGSGYGYIKLESLKCKPNYIDVTTMLESSNGNIDLYLENDYACKEIFAPDQYFTDLDIGTYEKYNVLDTNSHKLSYTVDLRDFNSTKLCYLMSSNNIIESTNINMNINLKYNCLNQEASTLYKTGNLLSKIYKRNTDITTAVSDCLKNALLKFDMLLRSCVNTITYMVANIHIIIVIVLAISAVIAISTYPILAIPIFIPFILYFAIPVVITIIAIAPIVGLLTIMLSILTVPFVIYLKVKQMTDPRYQRYWYQ
jgi:hypothetical protein